MTWPLATVLHREFASDLGDPVLNAWGLMWTSGQVLAALSGDPGALATYWQGNIFYPESLTIAFSEHLTPQMLQALPVYAATGNAILSYNLLFLSTFVLSGLGAYLLTRDLTGRPLAAIVAGLAFAWAPYRMAHLSHLQVLSSAWMPFALLGYYRYLATRRTRPLIGGTAALVAQNLSCGYYLLYFPPFVAAFCLAGLARYRLLGSWRAWRALGASALVVALLTWPFAAPYLSLRRGGDIGVRPVAEIQSYSADVWAVATASPLVRVWGDAMRAFPKAEGEGFPSFTILALALVALGAGIVRGARALVRREMPDWARGIAFGSLATLVVTVPLSAWCLMAGRVEIDIGGTFVSISGTRAPLAAVLAALSIVVAILMASEPRRPATHDAPGASDLPDALRTAGRPWVAFFAFAAITALFLSFGPVIESAGRPIGDGPYAWLLAFVPGFDGARAPARFLMVAALFLSVLAGLGAAALFARWPRHRWWLTGLAATGILAESWIAPMPIARPVLADPPVVAPTSFVAGTAIGGTVYGVVKSLPGQVVLVELPFGAPATDLSAVYYAGYHRRPVLNGYSGYFPASFGALAGGLSRVLDDPDRATAALAASGATHVVLQRGSFEGDGAQRVAGWLSAAGARVLAIDDARTLYALR